MKEQRFSFFSERGDIHKESWPTMEEAKEAARSYYTDDDLRAEKVYVGPLHFITVEACAPNASEIKEAMENAARDIAHFDDAVFEFKGSDGELEEEFLALLKKHFETGCYYMDHDECEVLTVEEGR